jgi:dienelactone hydrolase
MNVASQSKSVVSARVAIAASAAFRARQPGVQVMTRIMSANRTAAPFVQALLLGMILLLCRSALATESEDRFYPPDEAGPYSIGHATVIVTDTARNLDGSTPVSPAGRPLYLHLWYPTTATVTQHVTYTWNNPLYNENPGGAVHPGLPDLPALTFAGSPSSRPVRDGAPLAKGRFPLLVASHGNLVSAAKNMPDTLETLASHGYIVASVEHTGNDDAWYQADFLIARGLPLGPNTRLGPTDLILQRSKDVRFVIDAMLHGIVDQATGIAFARRIDADEIGVLGYSLGGETSLATVAGISAQGLPADPRVKAAFMGAGSNYGLLMNSVDYANAKVPLLFFGNDTGIAYNDFNQFTHSRPKYLVDVAGLSHHTAGYQTSWCPDFHNSMGVVNPAVFPTLFFGKPAVLGLNRTDAANYVYDATFYFIYTGIRQSGIYEYCDASVFDGISDAQLTAVNFGNAGITAVRDELKGLMPLKPEVSIAETTRLTNWYAVSFFNEALKHDDRYARYLKRSAANQRANPLVDLVKNCEQVKAHPIDLQPGDRITFVPVGSTGYQLSVASGATLYDPGSTKLKVAGDASVYLSYAGFSFPVPGLADPISTLIVNEDGAITARTSSDIGGIDDNGSPWYSKGQLLLSNRFTIAALMKNLNSSAAATGGGVFGYFDSANNRVIVTYKGVPAVGTTQPNTLQVAVYGNGKIEMTIGELAGTGANFSPRILGTIGIATGQTKASRLRHAKPIRFSRLRNSGAVIVPFGNDGAIYEQFYLGTDGSCHDAVDDDEEERD